MKWSRIVSLLLVLEWGAGQMPAAPGTTSLRGTLQDSAGRPLAEASVELRSADTRAAEAPPLRAKTDSLGGFQFGQLAPGRYAISVRPAGQPAAATAELTIEADDRVLVFKLLAADNRLQLQVEEGAAAGQAQATAKDNLGSQQVAGLPLEHRDSTNLLLLAAGTHTTTGTGANFTQQYSIHGQKGTTAVFALDGADTTDPENGGATISDFNVDAIQRIENLSGVLPASIGQGAAGYVNVISKSGGNRVHGNVYEFMRNSVFDARNYFDPDPSVISRRIPAFIRNEFGGTNGGPVVIPGVYNGRDRTFYFGEYQGLRQVLGTTQVLSVPSLAERAGIDTTAFPGDTLYVPLNAQIARLLDVYPRPNNSSGTYGPRTYTAASNVYTTNNQFSVRIDHRISAKAQLTGRFTWENIVGPITNPSQQAINRSFAQLFTEGYRSAAVHYVRAPSSTLTMVTTLGFIRSTPQYESLNQIQPGLTFTNKMFEAINSQAGGFRGLTGNSLQLRQTLAKIRGSHSFEMGVEVRFARNAEINSSNANGTFAFGGPAYSALAIPSASGQHNINPGDLLPDALSAFLSGTPSAYTRTISGRGFSGDNRVGQFSIHRDSYNFYFLDNWHAAPNILIIYGLRYELNTPMRVGENRAQGAQFFAPDGTKLYYPTPGATQQWVVNPDPLWNTDWNGWGPRLSLSWQARDKTLVRAAAGITTLLQYPWPNVTITNHFPFAVTLSPTARLGSPIPFDNTVTALVPPPIYTPQGALIDPATSSQWAGNTPVDVVRFEQELAALLPGKVIRPVQGQATAQNFRNGYLNTYTVGIQQEIWGFNLSASYIGLSGVHLQGQSYPNNYAGASPGFAPFSMFNAAGQVIGGFSQETLFDNSVHSSYNAAELVIRRAPTERSAGFSFSYSFAKSIDNATGFGGGGGGGRQNPQNAAAERARSSIPGPQSLSFNITARLPFDRWVSPGLIHGLVSGWQITGIGSFRSGTPFTVVSGIQQTGYGTSNGDRPNQVGTPVLSTSRSVRQDYFGMGTANAFYFSVPINVPGGTGPYRGLLGTLGRNTFTGPSLRNFDIALSKEINLVKGLKLQTRAEFYNVFNFVNFSTPNNVLTGSGFGMITSTASNSRQLQFSLKLVY